MVVGETEGPVQILVEADRATQEGALQRVDWGVVTWRGGRAKRELKARRLAKSTTSSSKTSVTPPRLGRFAIGAVFWSRIEQGASFGETKIQNTWEGAL